MFGRRNVLALYLGLAVGVALIAPSARAANVTLQGAIGRDDAIQLFNISLDTSALIDIRSYGYAGGTTSIGTVVPSGGFDTILTLFDSAGVFLTDNDEGAGAVDPVTGMAADARITTNLAAGGYIVALTQFDNFALGFNLSDGFVRTGTPNFTADPTFTSGGPCASGMFRDISGTSGRCRTGDWTIDFVNVTSATPATVPEPSVVVSVALGLGLLLVFRSRKAALLSGGLVAAIASGPIQAQTSSGPNYSSVSDFLNGQRTLIHVTDLQAFRLSTMTNNTDGPNIGNGQDIFQLPTSNSQPVYNNNEIYSDDPPADVSKPLLSFSARMFDQKSAVTLTTMHNYSTSGTLGLWLQNVDSLPGLKNGIWYPTTAPDNPTILSGSVADFNLNGYDELALGAFHGGTTYTLWVVTPNDVKDASKGPRRIWTYVNSALSAIAAGDFDGDGSREVAGLTVLPGGGLGLVMYTVNPTTLEIQAAYSSPFVLTTPPDASPGNPINHVSMVRGRFNSAGHDQLAITFATNTGSTIVEIIDFELKTLNPLEGPQLTASTIPVPVGYLQVKTGQFSFPNNSYDQIVFHMSSTSPGGRFFEVISADPSTLALTAHAQVSYSEYPCAIGIEVGNFDNRQPSSTPGQTQPNPNSQVALMYCNGSPRPDNDAWQDYQGFEINVYNVDSITSDLINPPASQINLGQYFWLSPDANTTAIAFVATDLQSRSITLGEPVKVSLDSTIQPTAVVGVPPMHVDFIDPGDGNPRVFNVSAVPEGFKTTYNQEQATSFASSTTNTTSWSFGAKETASAGFTIGDPDADGLKVSDTFTAAQNLKGSHEHTHGTYNGQSFNLSGITGFGDEVSYVESQFNIWLYPVIGQTVCPAAKPKCQPTEQVPLYIQYSAPDGDSQKPEAVEGQALQWYQPPWEPGNIFSYPANFDQFKVHYPDATLLTNDTTGFLTDGSTLTQTVTWSGSGEESDTTGLKQNYSFENDFSVNGAVGIEGLTAQGGYGLDVSGSVGFSNLVKTTTTLGESTGLQITKPGTFPAFQNFGYAVKPYIVGNMQPGGLVDNQPLKSDIQTVGVLRSVFTADPVSSNPPAGGWWQQAYTLAPDVALNHPSRWYISTPGLTNPIPSNCLATGTGASQMDCAELSSRFPSNPWLSITHFMRGFFISSGVSPGQGPQLEQAKAGDVLTLQTRVYNYSLAPMPTGTEVHVRFYFMPWNTTRNLPLEPNGNSYLISEEKVAAVPPFNESMGTSAQSNWVLIPTKFDTSKFDLTKNGDMTVVFWVVVWMQDQNGKIVGEMPAHGLTGIPSAGITDSNGQTTVHFPDVAGFEECQTQSGQSQCYSNNLGLYKQKFYVAPISSSTTPGPLPMSSSLDIGKVDVSATRVTTSDNVVLSATVSALGAAASGVSVNFYDGDPNQGGRLFAVERIPYIPANTQHMVQATQRSKTCGVHQLFVVINRGRTTEIVRRAQPVRVFCN